MVKNEEWGPLPPPPGDFAISLDNVAKPKTIKNDTKVNVNYLQVKGVNIKSIRI